MHQPLRGNDKNQIPLYSIPVARAKPLPLQCQKPDLFYANPQLPEGKKIVFAYTIPGASAVDDNTPMGIAIVDAPT